MPDWRDMHVLVTGASSGIGLAAAEQAAGRGASVTLAARDRGRLEAVRERVTAARRSDAQRVEVVTADVSSFDQVSAAVSSAVSRLGPVDVLIAAAGYCYPARFTEMPIDEFAGQVGVNLLGAIYAARAVAGEMIERRRGHIVLFSSIGGHIGVYGYSGYSPAKFGVIGLAEVLRSELKPHGIGVSVVCPPNVDTPGYARELAIEPPETARVNGNARPAAPADVARRALAAVDQGRFMVMPGVGLEVLRRLKGLVPELFFAIVDRDVAAVRKVARADA